MDWGSSRYTRRVFLVARDWRRERRPELGIEDKLGWTDRTGWALVDSRENRPNRGGWRMWIVAPVAEKGVLEARAK